MRLTGYVRVSSEEQVKGYSLEAQERDIKKWAAENGHEISKVFVEPGLSARTDDRPIFQSMIQIVLDGGADGIIIHKSDRIARNLLDLLTYKNQLEQSGKRVFSVVEPFFNSDSPENRMVTGIIGSVNEFYSANLGREVKKGQIQMARSGRYPGGRTPLGYIRDENKNVVIDPEHGPFIAWAFIEFATGKYNLRAWAAKAADEMGFTNARGQRLHHQSWRKIFRNSFYIGHFTWDKMVYQGNHPPLVDPLVFNAVQRILDTNDSGGAKTRHFWLLSGLIWSNKYQKRMTGSLSRSKYAYYRAQGDGPEHSIKADELEAGVVNLLKNIRGWSNNGPENWILAMRVSPSMADIWPHLTPPIEKRDFLKLIFKSHGIFVESGGAIIEFRLRPGFESCRAHFKCVTRGTLSLVLGFSG